MRPTNYPKTNKMSIVLYQPNPWFEPERQEELVNWFLVLIDQGLIDAFTLSTLFCVSKTFNKLLRKYYCPQILYNFNISVLPSFFLEIEELWTSYITYYPLDKTVFPHLIARNQAYLPLLKLCRSKLISHSGMKYNNLIKNS